MRLGVDISQHRLSWEALLARVRFAEEAGFHDDATYLPRPVAR